MSGLHGIRQALHLLNSKIQEMLRMQWDTWMELACVEFGSVQKCPQGVAETEGDLQGEIITGVGHAPQWGGGEEEDANSPGAALAPEADLHDHVVPDRTPVIVVKNLSSISLFPRGTKISSHIMILKFDDWHDLCLIANIWNHILILDTHWKTSYFFDYCIYKQQE